MPTTCKCVNLSMTELSECLLVEDDDLDKEISAGPSSAPEEQPFLLSLLRTLKPSHLVRERQIKCNPPTVVKKQYQSS